MQRKPSFPRNTSRSLAAGPLSKLGIATLTFAALSLVWCALASAGNYTIYNCPSAPTPNSDPGPWVIVASPQTSKAGCSGGSGDYIGPRSRA